MMRDLSVARITNGSCAEVLGGLSDLRMGATPHGQACQTCGHHPDILFCFGKKTNTWYHHHNCPGHTSF